jgi:hypothetical protein
LNSGCTLNRLRLVASLLAAAAIALAALPCAAEEKLPPKENFHLYLLVGQSNMAGRGKVEEQDRQPIPRVLVFNKENQWAPAIDPLHFDKTSAGVGVGRSFARAMAEAQPDVTIGLIPCAVGGSPIDSWTPGGEHKQANAHPYDDMLRRAKLALPAGTLKGILWHQGESDSSALLAGAYEAKLHALIARMRKELDAAEVPFLAGQMGQFAERPWNDAKQLVDAAHRALPEKAPHTAFVSSDGLTDKDGVHFDSPSYRELGRRYAYALLELTKQ